MNAQVETAGFRVVDILRQDEVDAMGAAITETIERVARALRALYQDSEPEAGLFDRLQRVAMRNSVYASALLSAVYADAHLDPRIACLAHDPRLLEAIAQQCGPFETHGVTLRVRCSVPAISKTLHGWHSDVAIHAPVRADSTCHTVLGACWIPLRDVDPASGSLEVVTIRLPAPLAHRRDTGSYVIDEALLEGLPRQAISVRAGQAAVIDRFTPHRSLPNPSEQVRWSVVAWVKGIPA
ncbi:phytanoyl-CoA dioxygenase family protein [Polaromonas sp.]|uniref:phytanoyl-CoA dioxygenase family protein n=1 Tax=Polaromonas sp. TaxID=1869339 RepID=UPI00326478A6